VENFDYIIKPAYQCRDSASHGRFGDGQATYSALTVAFWARFTRANQNAVILNIFGANSRLIIYLQSILVFNGTIMQTCNVCC